MSTATKAKPKFIARSLKETGAFFGVSVGTVKNWISRGCPATVGGGSVNGIYDLKQMLGWAKENVWIQRQSTEPDEGQSKAELEREKLRVEIESKRLKIEESKQRLIDRDVAKTEVRKMFSIVRNRLEAVPAEVACTIDPNQRAEVIVDWQHKIRLVLRELATGEALQESTDEGANDATDD